MSAPARLGPRERAQARQSLTERDYDVVVVGGVTGAGDDDAADADPLAAPDIRARSIGRALD